MQRDRTMQDVQGTGKVGYPGYGHMIEDYNEYNYCFQTGVCQKCHGRGEVR